MYGLWNIWFVHYFQIDVVTWCILGIISKTVIVRARQAAPKGGCLLQMSPAVAVVGAGLK